MTVEVIWGAGIIAALLLYWAFKLDNSTPSQWMRLILLTFVMLNLLFIPKAVIDEKTVQFPVVNASNEINASYTEFTYGTHAIVDTTSTTNQFYKTNLRFVYIMAMVVFLFIIKLVIDMWAGAAKLR